MKYTLAMRILFGFGLGTALSCCAAQKAPLLPAQQFQSIRREYELAAAGTGPTDDDRRRSIARVDSMREGLGQNCLDLALKYPSDPVAVDALMQAIWMVNNNAFPSSGPDGAGGKAMAIILRDHVTSEKIGPICLRISAGFRKE